ncbi:DNA polymerase-1 [Tamaricihabitans halophyticus]|uniref:DNA-directed DNA polymerase n=1 Tax=Tamaricihabitans halophyticus TaxID=1262583 RepID=A0A4R2QDX8_9PSEU|nr:bifunctional 3'-5' exonuclease/DNA polymerase [Tamaricihabitans halophyticus]TCP46849.1 DNA polymerase-1 [Tamaricihabitans halophyticus]
MRIVLIPDAEGTFRLRGVADGAPLPNNSPEWVDPVEQGVDPARIAELEHAHQPRWVIPAAEQLYPALYRAGIRLGRCHDLALTEALLLGHAGRHAAPHRLPAAWARLHGLPEPPDAEPALPHQPDQPGLFEPTGQPIPKGVEPLRAATEVYLAQQRAIAEAAQPQRLRLLAAAESAGALAAVEMAEEGLPWRTDVHLALLERLLGPRPSAGERPRKLAELAERISVAFGGRPINPDHPASVVRAFTSAGIDVPSTRAWVLREIDHPAIPDLLEYKELARLYAAHGWHWLQTWVSGGRFRPVYVVGGVVSGRWASRGGAALQLPKELRTAVRADAGHRLVVADAAQLEPRVLAALAKDDRLAQVSGSADLYENLAADSFAGDRARAKIAMLSAMYGGTSGEAGPLLATLRKRFPLAVDYVESAALAGERGELVRSQLGRTSPPPSEQWRAATGMSTEDAAAERRTRRIAREWGRFTRNFVVQATAAEWALVLLATLRGKLAEQAPGAHVVFYLHDEVLVHCPTEQADTVRALLRQSARIATELVFPGTKVRFPLEIAIVECYADAK